MVVVDFIPSPQPKELGYVHAAAIHTLAPARCRLDTAHYLWTALARRSLAATGMDVGHCRTHLGRAGSPRLLVATIAPRVLVKGGQR